jgi:hypothetical protein
MLATEYYSEKVVLHYADYPERLKGGSVQISFTEVIPDDG